MRHWLKNYWKNNVEFSKNYIVISTLRNIQIKVDWDTWAQITALFREQRNLYDESESSKFYFNETLIKELLEE